MFLILTCSKVVYFTTLVLCGTEFHLSLFQKPCSLQAHYFKVEIATVVSQKILKMCTYML